MINNGEYLAYTSLSSELLVLKVVEVPRSQWHKYIGRGQYPKLVIKPSTAKSTVPQPFHIEKQETSWDAIKGVLTRLVRACTNCQGLQEVIKSILK